MGGAGRWVTRTAPGRTDSTLPAAADPGAALPAGPRGEGPPASRRSARPNDDFYRVDTRLTLPDRRASTTGPSPSTATSSSEVTLTFDDLAAMDAVERDITLTCVSNEVGGPYVGGARWLGVPPHRPARPGRHRRHRGRPDPVHRRRRHDHQHPARGRPRRPRRDGRDRHERRAAAPRARLPGADGHARPLRLRQRLKWITRMTLTTYDDEQAYWTERDWADRRPDQDLEPHRHPQAAVGRSTPGTTVIGGVAWAQRRGIEQGRGPHRRRPLAARQARPRRRRRLLAPVVPARGTPAGPAPPRRARHQQGRRRADRRPGDAVPRGLQRHAGDRRHRRLSRLRPSRAATVPGSKPHLRQPRHRRPNARSTSSPPPRIRRKALHHETHRIRTTGLAALALTCSLDRPGRLRQRRGQRLLPRRTRQSDPDVRDEPESPSDEPMAADAGAAPFGPGCAAVPTSGDGSFDGMATTRSPPPPRQPAAQDAGRRRHRGRPGRHPELRRGAHGLRARPTTRSPRSRRRTSTRSSPTRRR